MKVKSKLALILAGSSLLLTACGNTKQASKSNNNEVAIYKQAKEPKEHIWLYARGTNDDSELDNIIFLKNGKIKTYSAGMLYKQRKIIQLKDVKNLSKTELKKKAIKWNDESNDPKYKKIRESDLIRKSGAEEAEKLAVSSVGESWNLIKHGSGHIKIGGKQYVIYSKINYFTDMQDLRTDDTDLKESEDGYLLQKTSNSKAKAVLDSSKEKGIKVVTSDSNKY